MLDVLLVAVGWALIALVVGDVFQTVLWSGAGGGPVTTRVTNVFRQGITRLARSRRKVMSALGPLALVIIVSTWAALLLIGFTLTMQMDPDAVVSSATREPADWCERAYVAGYAVFTLGNGDYVPVSDLMRTMFVLMSAAGLFLMTLSVTYLLPVISASVGARSLASSVLSLGSSAGETIVEAWDGHRVRLDDELRQWDQQLSTLGHQHLAYPVLHLFHSTDPQGSAPAAVVRIDEVLTLLDAVEPTAAPPRPERRQLRSTIERYVSTYGAPVDGAGPTPPAPDLSLLRAAGIPLRVTEQDFSQMLQALDRHRSRVHQVGAHAGSDER